MTRDEFGAKYLEMMNPGGKYPDITYREGFIYSGELAVLRAVICNCNYELCEGWVMKSPIPRDWE